MFLLCNSLCNVVASVSTRIHRVMLLQLLLMSRTLWYASSHSGTNVLFDKWYYQQPSWTTMLQFHVRCNSIEETCRCFYYKLSHHELFTYAGVFFRKFLHYFKLGRAVSLIIFTSGLTKDWYHALKNLQMTFPVFFPNSIYHIFQYVYQLQ